MVNRYIVTFLAIALLATGGYFIWQKIDATRNELDQYQISTVQRGDIEDLITATGTIQPREYVDVGAQVSGQLRKIHVEIGSVVKEGDLLAEIDPTVYLANVDARRAQLRNQRASLADRQSQLALAQLQLTRQKNLMVGDATTTESLQTAEAAVRSAQAQVEALNAQIEQAESTLRADEANLNYAKIYAPIDGVVVSITARQGQTLNATQQAPTLLRVADLSTMTVQTQVSEADVTQIRPNMDVYFTTLGSRGKRWYSNLRKVEPTPTVTNNVVLFNALFDVSNAQRNLLPQMTAQVFFVSAAAKDALIIPAGAVSLKRTEGGERRGRGKENKATEPVRAAAESIQPKQNGTPSRRESLLSEKPEREAREKSANSEESRSERKRMSAEQRQTLKEQRRQNKEEAVSDPQKSNEPIWTGIANGRQSTPREATVKVVNAEDKIEERKIRVGISNRVHVQVLSGLTEGERVVTGTKPPPGATRAANQRNALQSQSTGLGGPGGSSNFGQGGRGR